MNQNKKVTYGFLIALISLLTLPFALAGETYYCTERNTFVQDLDKAQYQETCEKAGFTPTGTKCCGEAEDGEEYFNDQTGGCWGGEGVLSVGVVPEEDKVINFDGVFQGCNIAGDARLLGVTDEHAQAPLINDNPFCTLDPTATFYCETTGNWEPTDGRLPNLLRTHPTDSAQQGCCQVGQCWNGNSCVDDQSDDPLAPSALGEFRCINSFWVDAQGKKIPDGGTVTGFCPQESMCFLNAQGNAADNGNVDGNPQCINDKQFVGDNLCEDGQWSSRTRTVALEMLDLATGDFTLICDDHENTLNTITLKTDSVSAGQWFQENTNNVCVLRLEDTGQIIIGTSYQEAPATDVISTLFGVPSCETSENEYESCDTTDTVWYNKELNTVIFSDQALTIGQPSFTQLAQTFLDNPLRALVDSLTDLISEPEFVIDESYQEITPQFKKLYISRKGNKEIFGVLDKTATEFALVQYKGFSTNICDFTSSFTQRRIAGDDNARHGIECTQESDPENFNVLAQGSSLVTINPEDIWPDLTSKLRVE